MIFRGEMTRRELLRIGSLSILSGGFLNRSASAKTTAAKPRSCIFIMLQGGPSHHDLWDPKPQAATDIRGPYSTIATSAPDLRFGELLPGCAEIADRLCVVRSMTHKFTNHTAGTYITLTGSTNQPDRDRDAQSNDFPGPGAVLNYLQRGTLNVPRSVSLPNWLSIPGFADRMPGQYGGFLGSAHDPTLIDGDPSDSQYQPLMLTMPTGLTADRLRTRVSLLRQLDRAAGLLERELNHRYDHLLQSAFDIVVAGHVRQALDLRQEPNAVRDRYGRNKFGQSLLLARRLVEAGVQFVAINALNQLWDTHSSLPGVYQRIVPPMDTGFSALIADLANRKMLDDTLVVNTGEFGRTPRMNAGAGRDHWPNVYSTVLAGGGVRGGYVHGSSDNLGAEVASQPVSPADILATMYRQMGVETSIELHDRFNRPFPLCDGRVLNELLA